MKGKFTFAAALVLLSGMLAVSAATAAGVDSSAARALERAGDGPVRGAYASWCHGGSGGRGTCTAIFKRDQRFILVWATTQTSVKKYKVCVRSPKGDRRCKRLKTSKLSKETIGDAFWFGRYFPHNAAGQYTVTWRVHGKQLGPELHFKQR